MEAFFFLIRNTLIYIYNAKKILSDDICVYVFFIILQNIVK